MSSPEQLLDKEAYHQLVISTHLIITKEMDFIVKDHPDWLITSYPKFVVMYQFFRMLRGESFVESCRRDGDQQHEYYALENEIRVRLDEIRAKLDPSDEYTKITLNDFQKRFTIRPKSV